MYNYGLGRSRLRGDDRLPSDDPWVPGSDASGESSGGNTEEPPMEYTAPPIEVTQSAVTVNRGLLTFGLIGALAGYMFGRGKRKGVMALAGGAAGALASRYMVH